MATSTTGSDARAIRSELREQDQLWLAGYRAGVSERFLPRLRRYVPVAVILASVAMLWELAFGRKGSGLFRDLLRYPAAIALFLVLVFAVGLLPLWLVLIGVSLWRTHERHRRLLYREPIDEPSFTDDRVSGLQTPADHPKL